MYIYLKSILLFLVFFNVSKKYEIAFLFTFVACIVFSLDGADLDSVSECLIQPTEAPAAWTQLSCTWDFCTASAMVTQTLGLRGGGVVNASEASVEFENKKQLDLCAFTHMFLPSPSLWLSYRTEVPGPAASHHLGAC